MMARTPKLQSVIIPGMGTGVGRVPPELCARQMRQAYDDVFVNPAPYKTWRDAQIKHQLLTTPPEFIRDLQNE